MKLRAFLYRAASLLGDINAVRKNKVPHRVVHKTATRTVNKLLNKAMRGIFK